MKWLVEGDGNGGENMRTSKNLGLNIYRGVRNGGKNKVRERIEGSFPPVLVGLEIHTYIYTYVYT